VPTSPEHAPKPYIAERSTESIFTEQTNAKIQID
jgi:hypothetical protein